MKPANNGTDEEICTKTEEDRTVTFKMSLEEAKKRALDLMHQGFH